MTRRQKVDEPDSVSKISENSILIFISICSIVYIE